MLRIVVSMQSALGQTDERAHFPALLLRVKPSPDDPKDLSTKHDGLVSLDLGPRSVDLTGKVLVLVGENCAKCDRRLDAQSLEVP
eukprot:5129383-Alexandrium_andersonii.AAC.1